MTPKVSVCIPVYNGAQYLRECLLSVSSQSFQDLEILIVDDGSTDDSLTIATEYSKQDSRVRVFRNAKNLGLVGNWNHSVRLARGEWIKFLFQDDLLAPGCITRMMAMNRGLADIIVARRGVAFAEDTPDAIKTIYNEYLTDNDLARHFPGSEEISAEQFRLLVIDLPDRNCIGEPSAVVVRKRAFARYGYFNPELVSLCDWEYFARVAVNTGLAYINESLATFRVHKGSQSSELREFSNFRANALDPLIIQHDLVYLPAYTGLRAAAARRYSDRYLRLQLAELVKKTWWEAATCPVHGQAKAQMARTLLRHPRMLMFPLGYLGVLAAKKFAQFGRLSAFL